MKSYVHDGKNINIEAEEIIIGKNVSFGRNISISLTGAFMIGDHSRLGDDVEIHGRNVFIGEHLYHSFGLRVGGGGSNGPISSLYIGDRCTIHNNLINICKPVTLGNDVGLSEDVTLMTHGFWLSVLDGFPASFSGIVIGSGTIIGYRSLVLPGVWTANNVVVGAQSVVSDPLDVESGIYVGNPAKFVRAVNPLAPGVKVKKLIDIAKDYRDIARYHGITDIPYIAYPLVYFRDFVINVETFEYSGVEDEETDDFRDYMRKWGIRIYTERPFASKAVPYENDNG
jgi:acetyltransferase-like isoleucine patch superfamily enzyme